MTAFTNSLKQRLSEVESDKLAAEKRSLKELEKQIVGHDVVRNTTRMIEVKVDENILVTREKECGDCHHNQSGICELNGCFINVITMIPMFTCSIGKW